MMFLSTQGIAVLRHREPMIAQAIVALQRRAYRVEAELVDFPALPPLKESPSDIMASDEVFHGVTIQSRLVAMLAVHSSTQGTRISRLCVAPENTGRGYATRLLRHVLESASLPVTVTTAAKNLPALALYGKLGFVTDQTHPSKEGLELVTLRFAKEPDRPEPPDGD